MKNCPGCSYANPNDSYFCAKCGRQLGSSPEDLNSTETYLTPLPVLAAGSTFAERYQIIEEIARIEQGQPRTDPVLPDKKTSVEIRRRRFPVSAVMMGFLAVAALGIGG